MLVESVEVVICATALTGGPLPFTNGALTIVAVPSRNATDPIGAVPVVPVTVAVIVTV